MRSILPMALVLASCSQAEQPAETSIPTGVFAGQGSGDRLCIAGRPGNYRAGLIIYGEGAANCSAVGRIEGEGTNMALVPRGEGDCRIPLSIDGDTMRIDTVPATCSYYCGPGAKLAGNVFLLASPAQTRDGSPAIAVDLAGDPLC